MASPDPAIESVRTSVRELLAARGWTYADLGREVGVAEVTIKRWMTADDLSLGRLASMARALGTTTFAVLRQAEQGQERTFSVSEAVEEALAADPEAHVAWDALRLGRAVDAVQAHYGHGDGPWFRLLGRLETLGLLDRLPAGRVRLAHQGIHNWLADGPLQRRYQAHLSRSVVQGWVGERTVQSATRVVGPSFFADAAAALRDLAHGWRDRAWRDQLSFPPEQQRRVRWMLVVQEAPDWPEVPPDAVDTQATRR